MEDKKPIPIDENALREKLLSYHVSFNPSSVDFLENEIEHVKTHTPLKLPETKKILQYAAVPAIVVVFGFLSYFGFNYIKDVSDNAATKKDTAITVKPTINPKVEIKKEEIKPTVATPTSIAPEVKKQDTIIASTPLVVVPKQIKDSNKKPTTEQVITPKKEDTTQATTTKPDTIKKSTVDTAGASKNKDTLTKKKKKKKKNSDVTDDIRQSTQQPNSADDDVVIPNN